jgi:hypothetical protein
MSYKDVREAMSFIYGNTQIVDLIISDVFFPTEDGLLILQEVTSKFDIPTVSKFLWLAILYLFRLKSTRYPNNFRTV